MKGGRSCRRSARRSAATAARSPACAPTTWPRSPFAPRSTAPGVPPEEIEDVWLGCANQAGEDNRNVARMARSARRAAGVGRRRHRQPPVRLGSRRDRRRVSCGDRRRRRSLRRGRCRVDVARAARHGEARRGVPARRSHPVRHDARLALPEPAARGAASRSRRWARPARTSPSAGRLARGPGRVRTALAAALGGRGGGRALRRRARRPSASSTATSIRARTRRWRSSPR